MRITRAGFVYQVYKSEEMAAGSGRPNRWNCIHIICEKSGKPTLAARNADTSARRKTSTKKVFSIYNRYSIFA